MIGNKEIDLLQMERVSRGGGKREEEGKGTEKG